MRANRSSVKILPVPLGQRPKRAARAVEAAGHDRCARFESLTKREREVMAGVVAGRLNKQIAADLGISEITVKVHRAQVMREMGADSFPDLARKAERLKG